MPRLPFLTPEEHAAFDTPPVFTNAERKRFFAVSQSLENLLVPLRTPTNQICFVLALGYFKATQRFFARQFHESDAAYVARQLGYLPGVFALSAYDEATARRHRKLILDYLGFQPFDEVAKQTLVQESRPLVRSQVRPQVILWHMLDILARRKTEIPHARILTDVITKHPSLLRWTSPWKGSGTMPTPCSKLVSFKSLVVMTVIGISTSCALLRTSFTACRIPSSISC